MSNGTVTFWIVILAIGAAFGALHGALFNDGPTLPGLIYGAGIGSLVVAYERGVFLGGYRDSLRRLPTLVYLAAAAVSSVLVIVVAMSATGLLIWALGIADKTLAEAVTPKLPTIPFAMAVSVVLVSVLRVRDLIGAETFANLILGRYHRPVSEERIFLFLDLAGSTAYAERHGDLAAQELLKAVFSAIAEPVRRHRGQVDDYVGDQVIISWPIARGLDGARCVACVFAIRRVLDRDRKRWIARFGLFPELRAALHGGTVVTAEVGVDRHKVAYFGDVMNATARLECLCRETGQSVLISDAVLARLPALPDGVGGGSPRGAPPERAQRDDGGPRAHGAAPAGAGRRDAAARRRRAALRPGARVGRAPTATGGRRAPEPGAVYADSTTTFVLTGVRE